MLFLGPLFRSSDFYWARYLWWAGWYSLQKPVELILNFCMFLHRKTPTIIYRQLCQNGNDGFRPARLLACDALNAGSLQMPFKDAWLSPTLRCPRGRLQFLAQLRAVRSGSCITTSTGGDYRRLHATSHPASARVCMQEKIPHADVPHKDTDQPDSSELWHVLTWKHHHWKHFNSRQSTRLWSYSKPAYSVVAAPIHSPAEKPQAHDELIHCIQQQAIASSWQHGPSTSATCLGEISPGWQKLHLMVC